MLKHQFILFSKSTVCFFKAVLLPILFLTSTIALYSQDSNYFEVTLLSNKDSLPIVNAHLTIVSMGKQKVYVSNHKGSFKLKKEIDRKVISAEFSALGFEKLLANNLLKNAYYLQPKTEKLSEILIVSKKDKPKLKLKPSLISRLNKSKMNFGWKDRSAVYIPYNSKYENAPLKRLKYKTADFKGVKGIEYLSFIANIYAVDKKTNLPGKPLIENIIAKKEFGKEWAVVDVSKYNIIIPKEGVFVIYEILDFDYYENKWLQSNVGAISAVPALETYKFDKNYISKSYNFYYTPQKLPIGFLAHGKTEAIGWVMVNRHYRIEIVQ